MTNRKLGTHRPIQPLQEPADFIHEFCKGIVRILMGRDFSRREVGYWDGDDFRTGGAGGFVWNEEKAAGRPFSVVLGRDEILGG